MKCDLCGAWEVAWVGPYGNLTGTKCRACGGTNCQVVEPTPPESACNSLLDGPEVDYPLTEEAMVNVRAAAILRALEDWRQGSEVVHRHDCGQQSGYACTCGLKAFMDRWTRLKDEEDKAV